MSEREFTRLVDRLGCERRKRAIRRRISGCRLSPPFSAAFSKIGDGERGMGMGIPRFPDSPIPRFPDSPIPRFPVPRSPFPVPRSPFLILEIAVFGRDKRQPEIRLRSQAIDRMGSTY